MEKTLIIIKPDAVSRGLIGEILSRYEKAGLKLVAAKMVTPSEDLAHKHYPTDRHEFIEGMGRKSLATYREQGLDAKEVLGTADPYEIGLKIQGWMVDFITSGPVMAIVLQGPDAIAKARKLTGHTIPVKAGSGTIRGDYSDDTPIKANAEQRPIHNLVHASGDKTEAEFEINLWFSEEELHSY
jgi:nucleoside-diphosphate kinase